MPGKFVHNFKWLIVALAALIMFINHGCNNAANNNKEPAVEAPPHGPKDGKDIEIVLTELNVGANDWMNDEPVKPPTDEEFLALAEEFGFPIDDQEELDSGGCGEEGVAPPLSSSCSISYSDEGPAYDGIGYTSASCYNYYAFPGDTSGESDCYIRFRNYWPGGSYYYGVTNACAAAASVWYHGRLNAYDTSKNVYLRLDRTWCSSSNCEDGFKIY